MQYYKESKQIPNIPTELGSDWWEDLFAPHFNALDWEMFSESHKDSESDDSDQNVYKRWQRKMNAMPTAISLSGKESPKQIKRTSDTFIRDVSTQTEKCIWNSKEIELMRQYIKTIKEENSSLRALVMEQSQRLEELERKCSVQNKQLDKKRVKLSELIKANDRFNILTQALSEHNERGSSLCTHLEQEVANKQEIIGRLELELSEKGKKDVSLEQENKKLKDWLNRVQSEFERQKELVLEDAKLSQQNEVYQLKKKLDEYEIELRREKEKHQATKTGLEQLMKHYSQPISAKQAADTDSSIKHIKLF